MKPLAIEDPFLFGEYFNVFWFHGCYVNGQSDFIQARLGYGLSQLVAEQDKNVMRIYFSRKEWTNAGKRYLAEVIVNPDILETLLGEIRSSADSLNSISRQMEKTALDLSTPAEQIKWLEQYHLPHHELWCLGQVANLLDLENTVLSDYLKSWLATTSLTGAELQLAFLALVTPRELSAAQREEREMLQLAAQAAPGNALEQHWAKYLWLQFGWTGPALSLDYFKEVHRGLYQEGQAGAMLQKVTAAHDALVHEKENLIAQLHMPAAMQRLFRLYEELLAMKTYRMDALFCSYNAIQPLLKKIAQDHYLSLRQIYFSYQPWLVESIRTGHFEADHLNALGNYSLQYYDGANFSLFLLDEARTFIEPLKKLLPARAEVKELRGECAYPGVVRGTVFVINNASEMDRFVEGSILVSVVTDPSLLPIMKKASAFVTNQGGLTCHAAIVARELKKPCVVGTKIGTYIFKDGDMVEVDAERGVVKKI